VTFFDRDSSHEAVLLTPILAEDGAILAPAGSHIDERLVHLGQHIGKSSYHDIAVRLHSIDVNGAKAPLFATLGHQAEPPTTSGGSDHEPQFSDLMNLPQNVGMFFFATKRLNVSQWDSTWFTKSPSSFKTTQSKGWSGFSRDVRTFGHPQLNVDLLHLAVELFNE
jgi:hypothetical protein